jgi:hypothetical protein
VRATSATPKSVDNIKVRTEAKAAENRCNENLTKTMLNKMVIKTEVSSGAKIRYLVPAEIQMPNVVAKNMLKSTSCRNLGLRIGLADSQMVATQTSVTKV